jgi:predicted methyltransferase
MFRSLALAAACVAALSGASPSMAQTAPPSAERLQYHYDIAVRVPSRSIEEVDRDPQRHPIDILTFAGIAPGQKIADVRPGAGYFTRLFAQVSASDEGDGQVYAFIPNRTMERDNPLIQPMVDGYRNVHRVNGNLDDETFAFPAPLDVVFMSQEYHDFTIPRFGVDVAKMNARVFAALKPGGVFVVIDHQAAPGTGISVAGTLHRIEGAELRRQVEAAGFVFDGETAVLANPADDHSINVFDAAIRGRTDQFVYRFRKPG